MIWRRSLATILAFLGVVLLAPADAPAASAEKPGAATNRGRICKAGIAAVMGRDPATIRVAAIEDGVVSLDHAREDDGGRRRFQCRLDGPRIIWRAAGTGVGGTGRWRAGPFDEVLTYGVGPDAVAVEVRYRDGSTSAERYPLGSL